MRKSLLIVFVLLVTVPLGTVAVLGFVAINRERETTVERYAILARSRLEEIDRLIASRVRTIEERLRDHLRRSPDIESMRETTRRTAEIRRMFEIDRQGEFVYPPAEHEMSLEEREFLELADDLELASVLAAGRRDTTHESGTATAWYTWFRGDGLNFIYREGYPDSTIKGIVLERTAFIALIIASLPESDSTAAEERSSRVVLTDARGRPLYQWGLRSPAEEESPVAAIALSHPLEAWHLALYLDTGSDAALAQSGYLALASGLFALGIAIAILSVYYYRESTRVVRDATQKVSFVNRVSHEFKTPLTNIRLYAELLGRRMGSEKDRTDLGIIVAESSRLGRMIDNVLAYARSGNRAIEAHRTAVSVDAVVERVVESFTPALESKRFTIELDLEARDPVPTDGDLVEQIVSNLVSNVEKYASDGKYLGITSHRGETTTSIRVSDRGPGIPESERKRIFDPFYRISDNLADGTSGAGIGLTISRELATILSGRLTLTQADSGASFTLELPTSAEGEIE